MPESSGLRSGGSVAVATVYALAAPGANTNIITPITPGPNASAFRVTVALTTSSVFNVRVTNGTTAYTLGLNGSVALAAGDLYTFVFGVRATSTQTGTTALTYSFQVETDSVINYLLVEEIIGGVV